MQKKIAFLGPYATFTDLAVSKIFPADEKVPYVTIPECFDAVANKDVDLAVVPLENALEGSVNITLDYLIHEVSLPVKAAIIAPIQQHLMVHPQYAGSNDQIEKVLSHSHAIAQCHKYLHNDLKGIKCENVTSTASAAQYVMNHPEQHVAAIANELAASVYGLQIVKRNIHDYSHNHTRFIVLGNNADPIQDAGDNQGYKTTIMVSLPSDQSGALHQVLAAFSWRKLNLSKIESRPMKTGLGNYFFIIDVDEQMDEILLPGAIAEMEALGCKVKVLGCYPTYAIHQESKSTI